MDKSPAAFRTISEVAEELAVPKHVLRFWEGKFNQLHPMKRGGGRRYYRPEDVDLLRGIRLLLYEEGFTIKGVQKILREQGVRFVMGCWRQSSEGDEATTLNNIHDVASEAARGAARTVQFGPGRIVAGQGTPSPAHEASPQAEGLSEHQIKLLDAVLSEIESCQVILAGSKDC